MAAVVEHQSPIGHGRPFTIGVCPGPDWQIVSTRGARGEPGERGPKGERGPAGPAAPTTVGWQIDRATFT